MDFKDQIHQLSERIDKLRDNIHTEEATKTALILPAIASLGYDIFNPLEVIPELDCDIAKKKGEKIDYAILKDGLPVMLIECKAWQQDLNLHDTQLKRYFVASNARFAILTNGIEYRFYTDLEKSNVMDEKPFLVIDMLNISDADIEQLKKFHKSYFDESNILSTAQELKYTLEIRNILTSILESPDADFVRFLIKKVDDGKVVTQRIIDMYTPLVKKAFNGIINDKIADRLGLAIKSEEQEPVQVSNPQPDETTTAPPTQEGVVFMSEDGRIITTQEEIDAFYIVKSIVREVVNPSRVTYKDTQSYFRIMLDDNRRKSLCIIEFGKRKKSIRLCLNGNTWGEPVQLNNIDDIYDYANELKNTALLYT